MVPIIDNGAIALTGLALDAATMRHQAIAQNIANANTPGYRPVTVSFEASVRALANRPLPTDAQTLASLRPALVLGAADSVSLDTEMARLSENTLHHQVLLKALTKQFALLGEAINGGKR